MRRVWQFERTTHMIYQRYHVWGAGRLRRRMSKVRCDYEYRAKVECRRCACIPKGAMALTSRSGLDLNQVLTPRQARAALFGTRGGGGHVQWETAFMTD